MAMIAAVATADRSHAAIAIVDLFNTGVNAAGDDPNYQIISGSTLVDAVVAAPPATWVSNNAGSRWIGPATTPDARAPGGAFTYETTFTLPANADLSSVAISGDWGTDNGGLDILINSVSTGQTSVGFTSLTAFSVTSGFQTGINTLQFVLNNATNANNSDNPTGLRVDNISGMYDVIPEPTSLLAWAGLAGCVFLRRGREAC
ncbi:hypothetical protein [Botrimarina sp.]|uniref:hypothetical protein n=1 Tax=Botrimarina sp. TaxID=2795802 RepID=UPI0032EF60DD